MDRIVRRIGGIGNAGTSTDYTIYYETVPTGMEQKVIDIEADRMAHALLMPADFASEIKVVKEERKMRNEDSPTGLFWEEINAAAFKIHPYGWPIIGWMEDLEKMDIEDVRDYYKSHYAPDNAIVVMVGDFKTSEAIEKIVAAFGDIPSSGKIKFDAPAAEPEQHVEKRIVFPTDKSNLGYVVATWHTPTYPDDDSPVLEIIDSILSSGRESRLFQTFVEGGLAGSAEAIHDTNTDPYLFYVEIEALPGVEETEIEAKLIEEIELLKTEPVSDYELQKAKNRFRADQVMDMQSISSFGRTMGWFELTTGNPEFWDTYLEKIDAVTVDDVLRVAKKYLIDTNKTTGILVPEAPAGAAAPVVPGPAKEYGYRDTGEPVAPAEEQQISLDEFPPIEFSKNVKRIELPNGLTLIVYENHAFPTVHIEGAIKGGGSYSDPEGLSGLGKLVSMTIRRGTAARTYEEINKMLEFVGADFEFFGGNESLAFAGDFLEKDFGMGFELMADMLLNPAFEEDDLEVERGVALADLAARMKNHRSRAWQACLELLYPNHPYSKPVDGTEEGLAAVATQDLKDFHAKNIRPDRTIIAVVGDVTVQDVKAAAEKYLGEWKRPDDTQFIVPEVVSGGTHETREVLMPEKMQGVFFMGFPGPEPEDPDYELFKIMTDILAGTDLTSRLYLSVREREGFVYYVYGYDLPKTGATSFQITAGLSPENFKKTLDLISEEIKRIQTEPVTREELADALSYKVGNKPLTLETNEEIALTLVTYAYHGRPFEDIDNYLETIKNITPDDIMRVAKKYLDPDKYVLGVAGPRIGDAE